MSRGKGLSAAPDFAAAARARGLLCRRLDAGAQVSLAIVLERPLHEALRSSLLKAAREASGTPLAML